MVFSGGGIFCQLCCSTRFTMARSIRAVARTRCSALDDELATHADLLGVDHHRDADSVGLDPGPHWHDDALCTHLHGGLVIVVVLTPTYKPIRVIETLAVLHLLISCLRHKVHHDMRRVPFGQQHKLTKVDSFGRAWGVDLPDDNVRCPGSDDQTFLLASRRCVDSRRVELDGDAVSDVVRVVGVHQEDGRLYHAFKHVEPHATCNL
jgi:hypothetical protein